MLADRAAGAVWLPPIYEPTPGADQLRRATIAELLQGAARAEVQEEAACGEQAAAAGNGGAEHDADARILRS
jgi:hypothetical protein